MEKTLPFRELIDRSLTRRSFVQKVTSSACLVALVQSQDHADGAEVARPVEELFQFKGVSISNADSVVVPEGYVAEVLYRWGDPIDGISPIFKSDASNSAAEQERQAGMGHDGMEFFAIPGSDPNLRGLLAINHEYTDQVLLFHDGIDPLPPAKMPLEKVRKSQASHGVSIIEIEKQRDGSWRIVPSSRCRRITAETPIKISGPAVSKIGDSVRGTVNNCAAGRTPWGTYLTCEENFHSVFGTKDRGFEPTPTQKAYGLDANGFAYSIDGKQVPAFRWWEQLDRFDLSHPANDSERFGYVVEIDPMSPDSTPIKRTALGRFRHENAELTVAEDGRVVIYMGDDEMEQYIYKFVSTDRWGGEILREDPSSMTSERLQAGGILDRGTLYAAQFSEDGTGRWLALIPGQNGIPSLTEDPKNGFDLAEICVRTREAAKMANATPMDRPEWLAVHPHSREVYASLTNNKNRQVANAANPRTKNVFGHIVRWREKDDNPASLEFRWQVFIFGGNPSHPDEKHRGSAKGDIFACPDGLKFDPTGTLWIQTDMSSSVMGKDRFAELGHNMMLAAHPATGETRRFLTGPTGCEITGHAMTPDRQTMFVNIQHPGEPADELSDPLAPQKYSQWPDGPSGGRPRSATVVIRRTDGGVIGD